MTSTRHVADGAGPWTSGSKAPVHEELTVADLPVTGRLPEQLEGRYLRNGPNPMGPVDPATHHWFTGTGMVHGLRLGGGRARWYRNRWVRSPEVAAALGEPAPPSPYPDDVGVFGANTNVIGHAGRTFALVEAGSPPVELTDELDTVGPTDFEGTLEHAYSAHPKRDPATGMLHTVSYFWGWGDRVQYTVLDRAGRISHTADLRVGGAPMVHDVSITETRAVVYDLPCQFDLGAAAGGASLPYRWDDSYPARIGVLPLGGGDDDVRWVDVEPCYVFHPLNAFDDGDRLVIDLVRWESMFRTEVLGPAEGTPWLERWTVDPSGTSVRTEVLDDRPQEFPRVDERLVGRRHRYGYSVEVGGGLEGTCSLRHDLERGVVERRDHGPGRGTGEMVFVPAADDAAEDEGWVLSFVHDLAEDRSDLLVLDAADFTGEPVATVHLPVRVPAGFHGNWVPDPA